MDFRHVNDVRQFNPEKYQKRSLLEAERSAMDVYCLLPGQAQKVHAHKETEKYYYVLEGTAVVTIGDQEREAGPGWAALARPEVPHGIRNPGPEPLVVLVFQAPKSY